MTQHIIDTEQIEKLQQFVMLDMTNGVEQCKHGDYVHIDDLRALIASSPQADGMVLVPSEPTREMLIAGFKAWNACDTSKNNTQFTDWRDAYKAMLSAYKPQADEKEKL